VDTKPTGTAFPVLRNSTPVLPVGSPGVYRVDRIAGFTAFPPAGPRIDPLVVPKNVGQ